MKRQWIEGAGACGVSVALAASPVSLAAPARPRKAPDPVSKRPAPAGQTAAAGEIRLEVARTTFSRTASLTFDGSGNPIPGDARAEAVVEVSLRSRRPDALDRIVRGVLSSPVRVRVLDERRQRVPRVAARVVETDDGPLLRLVVSGLSPHASGLVRIEGALPVYPDARVIRFHVPWLKDEVPLSVEAGGGTATLNRFQLVEADSTLWVSIRPPEGFRVASPEQRAVQARAVDIYGNLVNGGGIADVEETAGGPAPEFRFFAPLLRRTPSRLMLDVLCVSGEPKPSPFVLGEIPFPRTRR
jgi:hypothetical protein